MVSEEGARSRTRPSGRRVLILSGIGALVAAGVGLVASLVRFAIPDVLYEPPRRVPVGRPSDFPPRSVTFLAEPRLFVGNTPEGFYVLSAVCTHLGCNVTHVEGRGYECPCHGSTFDEAGRVTNGPAAWALPRLALGLSRRGELVVDTRRTVGVDYRFKVKVQA